MSRCFLLILFAVACAIPTLAQGGGVAGTWDVTLNSPQGTFNMQFNLKQDGEKVTGVVKSQRGERPLEGTIKGKDVTIKWTTKYEDNDLPITLTGKVTSVVSTLIMSPASTSSGPWAVEVSPGS